MKRREQGCSPAISTLPRTLSRTHGIRRRAREVCNERREYRYACRDSRARESGHGRHHRPRHLSGLRSDARSGAGPGSGATAPQEVVVTGSRIAGAEHHEHQPHPGGDVGGHPARRHDRTSATSSTSCRRTINEHDGAGPRQPHERPHYTPAASRRRTCADSARTARWCW